MRKFIQFQLLDGCWQALWYDEICDIRQSEYWHPKPDSTDGWGSSQVTVIATKTRTFVVREPYDFVMSKAVKAWQGEE